MTETRSAVQILTEALPYPVRRALTIDHRIIAAAHTLGDQGADLEQVAQRISTGLHHRPRAEVGRIARYRLLRDAGMLNEGDDA